MENFGLKEQIRRNSLSFLSLIVALSALFYNTWRNESTEHNRNIRVAEFEILKDLGNLQELIDYAHFRKDQQKGDLTHGLAYVQAIKDLSALTPKPVEDAAEQLAEAWRKDGEQLPVSLDAASHLSEQVLTMRRTVMESLRSLK